MTESIKPPKGSASCNDQFVRLNLGCGGRKYDGYINVDLNGSPDVRVDLDVFPWPWEDSSVDEVYSEHWLEHVNDLEKTLIEAHRILKPGGVFRAHVPHFRWAPAVWHLHRWQFSAYTVQILCDHSIKYQFGGRKLFCNPQASYAFYVFRPFVNKLLAKLANRSTLRWDILGLPVEEVRFSMQKVSGQPGGI